MCFFALFLLIGYTGGVTRCFCISYFVLCIFLFYIYILHGCFLVTLYLGMYLFCLFSLLIGVFAVGEKAHDVCYRN